MEHQISEEEWELVLDVLSGVKEEREPKFQDWLSSDSANQHYFDDLKKINDLGVDLGVEQQFDIDAMWSNINDRIEVFDSSHTHTKWYKRFVVKVAASILLPVFFVGGGYLVGRMSSKDLRQFATVFDNSINPGTSKAHLILADGTKVDLSSNALIKEEDGTIISNSAKSLSYDEHNARGSACANTLVVPIGGEYKLVLADGTRVWLNSGSTLKYPTSFSGERRVELTGEAYFEVKKDLKHPFRVAVRGFTVTALGTAFNVDAYQSLRFVKTTLVEGAVALASPNGSKVYLKPCDAGVFNEANNSFCIEHNVSLDLYVAWKDGYFKFKEQFLEDITDRLGRWYNCQFIFKDDALRKIRFTGIVEKNKPLVYVLSKISSIKDVDYEVKGDVVLLKRKI